MMNSVRVGFQLTGEHERDPLTAARRAEELGFDIVLASDHVGPGPAPLPMLASMAAVTTTIRLGTFVLNNDMRNPVQLAWEAATIDRLSNGRFELGLGAGHTPQEYAATGLGMSAALERKERLAESVEIIRQLLDGSPVDFDGVHYQVRDAQIDAAAQERLPILVGGNGARLLEHAGSHADIIGLQGLGPTADDGHSHGVRWDTDWLDAQVGQVRDGAGDRFDQVEMNALVQLVEVTDDRDVALAAICERVRGLSIDDAAEIPYILVGSVDEIVQQMRTGKERWGISYYVVRELDAFRPILDALG
jgi:probable F420-dependent oxidoreductase